MGAVPPALVEVGHPPAFGFAGANLDFFPLGTVARRTGIVHIRRVHRRRARLQVGPAHLHRASWSRDSANLIWSIEGGRSRTGKLRPPRFGLLRYVVDAVDEVDGAGGAARPGLDHLRPAARSTRWR